MHCRHHIQNLYIIELYKLDTQNWGGIQKSDPKPGIPHTRPWPKVPTPPGYGGCKHCLFWQGIHICPSFISPINQIVKPVFLKVGVCSIFEAPERCGKWRFSKLLAFRVVASGHVNHFRPGLILNSHECFIWKAGVAMFPTLQHNPCPWNILVACLD